MSSLRLSVEPLNDWDYHWMERHEEHIEPDQKHIYDPTSVLYGLLPGRGGDGGEELEGDIDDEHLPMCCGERRPLPR